LFSHLKTNHYEWLDQVEPDIEFAKQRFCFVNSLAGFRNTLSIFGKN